MQRIVVAISELRALSSVKSTFCDSGAEKDLGPVDPSAFAERPLPRSLTLETTQAGPAVSAESAKPKYQRHSTLAFGGDCALIDLPWLILAHCAATVGDSSTSRYAANEFYVCWAKRLCQ